MGRAPRTLTALGALALAACGGGPGEDAMARGAALTGGDAHRGPAAIRSRGCGACHTVPGVPGADGRVGPPLAGVGGRTYLAGVLANSPGNLVRWIMDPTAVDSATAMPDLGVTEAEARDIAAYLYALE
jgi:cytochrome c1